MIRKALLIISTILVLLLKDAASQNSQLLCFMNLPQNHLVNPALRPTSSLYIGLPGFSGASFNVDNNFVNLEDVLTSGESIDSIFTFLHPDFNIDQFISKTNGKNTFEPQVTLPIFSIGLSVGEDSYIFFDINERIDANMIIPGDLLRIIFQDDGNFVNKSIDLSAMRADAKYYREYGLGFSRNFTPKLRIGMKGKILTGISSLSIDNRSLVMTVNDDLTRTITSDLVVNASAPLIVGRDDENKIQRIGIDKDRFKTTREIINYMVGFQNPGLSFDLGATYSITDKINLNAAVTDLGFIKWKRDVFNFKVASSFKTSGLNIPVILDGKKTIDEVVSEMIDSLKNAISLSDSNNPYKTFLPFGVSVGGSYSLTKSISLGLLSYTRFMGNQVREALTISSNVNLKNIFSFSFGYTMANQRYDNIGAGISFRAGFFQIYCLTDNVPIAWSTVRYNTTETIYNSSGDGTENIVPHKLTLPSNWNSINFRIGVNLVFGNGIKKKDDKPMVVVEQ